MQREERLQRVAERKNVFQAKKVVMDIMDELLVGVKRYRVTEMTGALVGT